MSHLRKIVNRAIKFTINHLKDKGLISLYLSGSILTRDRVEDSDIDLFGIVSQDFNFIEEKRINEQLYSIRNQLLEGITAKFRAIPINSLEGGKQEGIIQFFRPERFIKRLPLFKLVWGKRIIVQNLKLKPMTLKTEAIHLINQINDSIKDILAGTEKFPIRDFPKHVMELVRIEAEKDGFKYNLSYIKLSKFFKNEREHIVHKALELRQQNASRKEIVEFCKDVSIYIRRLKIQIKYW